MTFDLKELDNESLKLFLNMDFVEGPSEYVAALLEAVKRELNLREQND